MRSDTSRVDDMVASCESIGLYQPYTETDQSSMAVDAIEYNLIAIGEAARLLSDEFTSAHPDTPWRRVIGLRNILTHEYFHVNPGLVTQIARRDVPALLTDLTRTSR